MFTRILVPTDFSAASDAALDYARLLAARLHGTLQLVHVTLAAPTAPLAPGSEACIGSTLIDGDAPVSDAEEQLRQRIRESDRRMFGATTRVLPGAGRTAQVIVKYALAQRFDLIVMGTRGRKGFIRLLWGSVAGSVAQMAPCPVVTVRTPSPDCAVAVAARATVA
jgi:nucleotide-binding universal stress UspA family protein